MAMGKPTDPLVLEEMGADRRQFAVALYETIRLAAALGMSGEPMHYHLTYAMERFRGGE